MGQSQTGKILTAFFRLLAAILITCCLTACSRGKTAAVHPAHSPQDGGQSSLPRIDPGYVQWLERQSMLGMAQQFTGQVSGTGRLWRVSGSRQNPSILLEAAPNWLYVNPHTTGSGQDFFRRMAREDLGDILPKLGIGGLYVAPTGERGDIWVKPESAAFLDGSNVTALRFDPSLGGDEDFDKLARRMDSLRIQLGGDLLPAATGLGPDFMLQARKAARYDGIYAMLPVPQKDWPILPDIADEWEVLPLDANTVSALANQGIVPDALARDALPWAVKGGWAATGEIRGIDGQKRRWIYRYHDNPFRPVLLWQDPSGQARRIFSAAAIRHTGLQQQALAGLRMEALLGLEADAQAQKDAPLRGMEPGLTALREASQEIRRYGGWSMNAEILQPSHIPAVQAATVDFCRDSITPAAGAYALLTGDAAPLAQLLAAGKNADVDQSRMARGIGDGESINWQPLLDLPNGAELLRTVQGRMGQALTDGATWTTPASLAARVLGLSAGGPAEDAVAPLHKASLLLLAWRIGLPGLSFVSPQELAGALDPPTASGDKNNTGLTPLWGESPIGRVGGRPPAPLAFGNLNVQWANPRSFLHLVRRLLLARQAAGLAQGRLSAVLQGPEGCVGALSDLPGGGRWLLIANYSTEKREFPVRFPVSGRTRNAFDITAGRDVPLAIGNEHSFSLGPREARHILLAAGAEGISTIFKDEQP